VCGVTPFAETGSARGIGDDLADHARAEVCISPALEQVVRGLHGADIVTQHGKRLVGQQGVSVGLALALLHAHLHPIAVDMHRLDGCALQQTYSRRVQQHDDGLVSDLPKPPEAERPESRRQRPAGIRDLTGTKIYAKNVSVTDRDSNRGNHAVDLLTR